MVFQPQPYSVIAVYQDFFDCSSNKICVQFRIAFFLSENSSQAASLVFSGVNVLIHHLGDFYQLP